MLAGDEIKFVAGESRHVIEGEIEKDLNRYLLVKVKNSKATMLIRKAQVVKVIGRSEI